MKRLRALDAPSQAPIAVGFSGGVDSLCLASALGAAGQVVNRRVHLIHVDHGIRDESARDAERARKRADMLELPITVKALPPGLPLRTAGIGLEEAGRRERYLAFRDVCRDLGTDLIALGHHRQDQAESVLLHLVRGAGLTGAAAMGELTTLRVPWWTDDGPIDLRIWRPLLDESRAEIASYVESIDLTPIEDPSNLDQELLRNWLRHDLIPRFDERRPGAAANLARFARIAADEDHYLDSIADVVLLDAIDSSGGLIWARLAGEPIPIKRRAARRWLTQAVPHQEFAFERIEAVLSFAEKGNPEKMLQLGGDAITVWDGGTLRAGPIRTVLNSLHGTFKGPLAPDGFKPAQLQSGQEYEIDGWRIVAHGPGALDLRQTRRGDRLTGSNQPVRDLARRARLHPLLRDRLLVAATPAGPIWAAGIESGNLTLRDAGWRFEMSNIEETE